MTDKDYLIVVAAKQIVREAREWSEKMSPEQKRNPIIVDDDELLDIVIRNFQLAKLEEQG